MRIAHVASEVAPYSQTGGLAQVAAALPAALASLPPTEVAIFTPLYPAVRRVLESRGETLGPAQAQVRIAFDGRDHEGHFQSLLLDSGVTIHFFHCPALFERDGIYAGPNSDYSDNAERFATFSQATLLAATALMGGAPDVFHCHDWPTGLLPILLREHHRSRLPKARTVFTIHNLAYQGCFSKELINDLRLPWSAFTMQGLEFYDQVNMLKAGVAFSEATTTVSVSYANEIRTPEFGCHLEEFLQYDCSRLLGIANGIDVKEWDPASDPHIAGGFDQSKVDGKTECRQALLREYALEAASDQLLVGMVTRLADQKGLDLVAEIIPDLHAMGVRLVLLGNGEAQLEERFRWLSQVFADNLSVHIGFDTARAHRVFAGADAFLMPSRFEPCGLGQMAAMRYGTVPIVHAVGGLADTVDDPGEEAMAQGLGTGFHFAPATPDQLRHALARAARIHRSAPGTWAGLMQRGMKADWSWTASAREYLQLYSQLNAPEHTPDQE